MKPPSETLFQCDFSYVLEDLAEAQKTHRPEDGKNPYKSLIGWIFFIGLAVILFNYLNENQPVTSRRNKANRVVSPLDMAAFVAPWIISFVFIGYFVLNNIRGRAKKAWDSNEKLHCPQKLEVTVDGISFESQYGAIVQKWPAFQRFLESKNLFVLYSSPISMSIVPKRAFPNPADLEWFRALLNKEITERRAAAGIGGFPVLPPSQNQIASDGGKNAD